MNMTDIIVEGPQRPRDSSQRLTLCGISLGAGF
jgi:hypothetical protein